MENLLPDSPLGQEILVFQESINNVVNFKFWHLNEQLKTWVVLCSNIDY